MTRSSISAVFLGITLFVGSSYAQPVINTGGLVNNYSYVLPGLPNYGIAQGSIFDIFGTGLAASTVSQGVPLKTTLGGTSISVTVKGVTTQALPYFVSPLEIAAILPSATPVGTGTITVTTGSQTSAPVAITVVESAFGILTANESGSGAAAAYDYNNSNTFLTPTAAANPGEYLILWGSGLGPVTGDETTYQTQTNLSNIPIQVSVGGVNATVSYHGRSIYPGLDQVNVLIPAGVSGCNVSVVVTENGVNSNYVTIPVAASGRTCSDPQSSPISTSDWETLLSLGNANLGLISLSKSTVTSPTTGTTTQDIAAAFFVKYTAAQLAASGFGTSVSIGSCVVTTFSGTSAPTGLITSSPLNAGTQINLNGPDGALTLSPVQTGFYTEPFSTSPPAIIPAAGGNFKFDNGSGGPDVGAFTASLNADLTTPLVWTNVGSITSVTRANGLQVTWTGGIPGSYVDITGTSFTFNGTDVTSEFGAVFSCAAPVSAGQFTVPSAVLESLPASASVGSFSLPGFLFLENGIAQKFTAPGLNLGLLVFAVESQLQVPFI